MICKICNPNKTIIHQCPCDELIIDEWGVSEMECPKCNGTMRRMVNGYWCPKCGKIVKDRVWDTVDGKVKKWEGTNIQQKGNWQKD